MMKKKKFDCVAMKNRIQEELRAEYEARKGEFSSYGAFARAQAAQSKTKLRLKAKPHQRLHDEKNT